MILVWSQIQQSRFRHSQKRLKKLPFQWDYILLSVRPNECMFFNQVQSADIQKLDDSYLEVANDLKYLGSWIGSSEHDSQVQKALACNALSKIWKSSLSRSINECLFQAIVESIRLLYGAESWTMTNKIQSNFTVVTQGCWELLSTSVGKIKRQTKNCMETFHTYPRKLKNNNSDLQGTVSDARRKLHLASSCGHPNMVTRNPDGLQQPRWMFLSKTPAWQKRSLKLPWWTEVSRSATEVDLDLVSEWVMQNMFLCFYSTKMYRGFKSKWSTSVTIECLEIRVKILLLVFVKHVI